MHRHYIKYLIQLLIRDCKATILLLSSVLVIMISPNISAEGIHGKVYVYDKERDTELIYELKDVNHPELLQYGYYLNSSYDLVYDFFGEEVNEELHWIRESEDNWKTMRLYFFDGIFSGGYLLPSCKDLTIRIPDSVNGIPVTEFYKSGAFKAFDVNPQNKYFKSDGQVVLSKDGKKLLSYAVYNDSIEYTVPQGTEIIRDSAFWESRNLKVVHLPDSIRTIERNAFANMWTLESVVFDDFNVEIDKSAFIGYTFSTDQTNASLLCTKTTEVSTRGNKLSWKSVDGASYYEVYQKLNNGEYKLIKTTRANSCKFTTLSTGKKYTFAVKPVAVISAANYDKEKDEGSYPETFTIEGTMSEDIVVIGK